MNFSDLMSRVRNSSSGGLAFGPMHEWGDVLIIPVAIVGGGGGGGEAGPTEASGDDAAVPPSVGGGWGGVTWPLGVYVVKGERVRWVPAVDATRIALAALGIAKVALMIRSRRNR